MSRKLLERRIAMMRMEQLIFRNTMIDLDEEIKRYKRTKKGDVRSP